jgi:hypothetical protein
VENQRDPIRSSGYEGSELTEPKVFNGNSRYPLDYKDGAIPIQLPGGYVPYLGGYQEGWSLARKVDFIWTDDQLRRVVLVIRAVSHLVIFDIKLISS